MHLEGRELEAALAAHTEPVEFRNSFSETRSLWPDDALAVVRQGDFIGVASRERFIYYVRARHAMTQHSDSRVTTRRPRKDGGQFIAPGKPHFVEHKPIFSR